MDALEIGSGQYLCDIAADSPAVVEVQPGQELRVHCRSAIDRVVGPEDDRAEKANPGTGPIAVAGAEPGMALRVDILDIQCESTGYVSAGWGGKKPPQAVEVRDGKAHFHGQAIPLRPMIGMIGVAPGEGSWSTMDSGPWGGNMDTNDVAPGASLFLPVYQPGGKLILGDIHAVMGDGEIGGQGVEIAATVTMRITLEPDPVTPEVHLVRRGHFMLLGMAETIEEAVRSAAIATGKVVEKGTGLDEFNAQKILGFVGETLFGQHCCPIKSVRVAVPLEYLGTVGARFS